MKHLRLDYGDFDFDITPLPLDACIQNLIIVDDHSMDIALLQDVSSNVDDVIQNLSSIVDNVAESHSDLASEPGDDFNSDKENYIIIMMYMMMMNIIMNSMMKQNNISTMSCFMRASTTSRIVRILVPDQEISICLSIESAEAKSLL